MAAEPIETFVGWTAIGFGVIFVYAAITKKSVMKDILGPALTTGKIPTFKAATPSTAKTNTAPGAPGSPVYGPPIPTVD